MTIRIGITGDQGFIGSHLASLIRGRNDFIYVPFQRDFFNKPEKLKDWGSRCDAIVHLAGVSRSTTPQAMYDLNFSLTRKLADAVKCLSAPPKVLLGSTTHFAKDTPYHASKRDSYSLLTQELPCAIDLHMANTFGSGSRPFYNSVVSTFCYLAAEKQTPDAVNDVNLQLIYVDDLCRGILKAVTDCGKSCVYEIPHTVEISLPCLWNTLMAWASMPKEQLPELKTLFDVQLWITFCSYCKK